MENEQLYHSIRPKVGCSLLSLLTHLQCGDNYCEIKKIILMQLGYRQENAFKTLRKFHLSMMKPSAFIINTSRGKLANNKELAKVLNEGVIAGAGLDVLAVEPPEDTFSVYHSFCFRS